MKKIFKTIILLLLLTSIFNFGNIFISSFANVGEDPVITLKVSSEYYHELGTP